MKKLVRQTFDKPLLLYRKILPTKKNDFDENSQSEEMEFTSEPLQFLPSKLKNDNQNNEIKNMIGIIDNFNQSNSLMNKRSYVINCSDVSYITLNNLIMYVFYRCFLFRKVI